jgi:aquaporin TIP
MNWKALLAEFLGVFTLCFVGIGVFNATQGADLLTIALGHALAIALMITAMGHLSGAHFNPAVTFAFWGLGQLTLQTAAAYMAAQLLGGLAGSALIGVVYGEGAVAAGTPVPGNGVGVVQATLLEAVLTFFLVWVILGAAYNRQYSFAGLVIGLTVAMDILVGGPISGAAMNPARVLGPALVGGEWSAHWIYWVGPLVGGGLAAVIYQAVYPPQPATPAPTPEAVSNPTTEPNDD